MSLQHYTVEDGMANPAVYKKMSAFINQVLQDLEWDIRVESGVDDPGIRFDTMQDGSEYIHFITTKVYDFIDNAVWTIQDDDQKPSDLLDYVPDDLSEIALNEIVGSISTVRYPAKEYGT